MTVDATRQLRMDGVVAGYFEHDTVLDDVTLIANPGAVTVVLGPNGSGKSTSLRVMAGFLEPRHGSVKLGEQDITHAAPHERLAMGMAFLPQGRSTFTGLTVEENLQLGAWIWRDQPDRVGAAIEHAYERNPALADMRSARAGALSGGQQRMVELARTLILDPEVLLIDEPSVGLAPKLVDDVYEEIGNLKDEGRTILLVDQNVSAAVGLADHVFTLAYGHNDLDGDSAEFEKRLGEVIRGWLEL